MEMAFSAINVPIANCPPFKFAPFKPRHTLNLKRQNSSNHGLSPRFGLSFSSVAGRVRASAAANKPIIPKTNTKSNYHEDHDGVSDDRTGEAQKYVEEDLELERIMEECQEFLLLINRTFEERKKNFFRCLAEGKTIPKISRLVQQIKEILLNEQRRNSSERRRRQTTYIKLYLAQKIARALSRFWQKKNIDPKCQAVIDMYTNDCDRLIEEIERSLKPLGKTEMKELLKMYGYEDNDENTEEKEEEEDENKDEVEDAQDEKEESEYEDEGEEQDEDEEDEEEENSEDVEDEKPESEEEKEYTEGDVEYMAEDAKGYEKKESKFVDDEKDKNKCKEDEDTKKGVKKVKGKKRGVHLTAIYLAFLAAMFIGFLVKKKK